MRAEEIEWEGTFLFRPLKRPAGSPSQSCKLRWACSAKSATCCARNVHATDVAFTPAWRGARKPNAAKQRSRHERKPASTGSRRAASTRHVAIACYGCLLPSLAATGHGQHGLSQQEGFWQRFETIAVSCHLFLRHKAKRSQRNCLAVLAKRLLQRGYTVSE